MAAPFDPESFFFVRRWEGGAYVFDVIFPGGGRNKDHFPRLICTCQNNEDARMVCDGLAALDREIEAEQGYDDDEDGIPR